MTNIEQALLSVRDVYIHLPKRYEEVQKEIKKCELELEDLEHVIELHNFNASKGYQLAKEIQKTRKRRRDLKNELEQLESIRRLNAIGKPTEKHLNQAIGEVRSVTERQKNRCYSMRVRNDLQELVR